MCAKLFMTVLVPAPEEPVTAMTGCLVDMCVLAGELFGRGVVVCVQSARRQFALGRNSDRSLNSGDE